MTYKKVTPISKGVLRIRSEPDESGRVCGSVSYGEEVTVETTKVTSKKGKEYYRILQTGGIWLYFSVTGKGCRIADRGRGESGCSGQESGISSEQSGTGSKGV